MPAETGSGWKQRFKDAMARSRETLNAPLGSVLRRGRIDEDALEQLEEALIKADVGIDAAMELTEAARRAAKRESAGQEDISAVLREKLVETLGRAGAAPTVFDGSKELTALILIGVNGAGKTTTAGKLAHLVKARGGKAILAAADTYRAAAIEQAEEWAVRAGADIVKHQRGGDGAAVTYDALRAARARGADFVIIDTAGRLHTKTPLMEELKKIKNVVSREEPNARVFTLLVLDATTGQNGLAQAKTFGDEIGIDGIVLTKLDGTARGGIVVAVAIALKIPVAFVGIGEGIDDVAEFDAEEFAASLIS